MDREQLSTLAERLGHAFADPELLVDALTHRSFVHEHPRRARAHNERMEFLGDAILELAASGLLFRRFPGAREGELTRRRADLVCERSLAAIARDLDLGTLLRLGRGEEKSGGRDKPRLLASALEAVVAAIYLDGGEVDAVRAGSALLGPYVDRAEPGGLDHKSRVQELLQGAGRPPPTYVLTSTDGPDHARTFHVELRVDGRRLGDGSGTSKARAEQRAALAALALLEDGLGQEGGRDA